MYLPPGPHPPGPNLKYDWVSIVMFNIYHFTFLKEFICPSLYLNKFGLEKYISRYFESIIPCPIGINLYSFSWSWQVWDYIGAFEFHTMLNYKEYENTWRTWHWCLGTMIINCQFRMLQLTILRYCFHWSNWPIWIPSFGPLYCFGIEFSSMCSNSLAPGPCRAEWQRDDLHPNHMASNGCLV